MSEITITADPNYFEGTINGRPIAGYHMVQYGETQELLESLIKEGVILIYHEDNPPEEGKLTLTKPNPEPDPGTITISPVANPTEYIYGPYEPLQLTEEELIATLGPEKYEALINTTITATTPTSTADTTVTDSTALIAGLKSYLEEIAPKMSDIDSLTDEEVASFNETLKSYKEALRQAGVATCLADTTLDPRTDTGMNLETLDPRTDTSLTALLDSYIAALDEKEATTTDTTVTDTADNVTAQNADPGLCGPQPQIIFDPEYATQMEEQLNVKFRQSGYGRGQAFFRFIYDSDEAITPSGYELVRTESWSGPDCTDEQIADIARYIIQNDFFYGEQQKALMLEAVDAFLANPKKAQSIFDLTFTSTMDAETEAVTSVQVACAEDGGWRTIGTLNNPDGIDWKYQAGNLTGSGTASVVWHAQELGALGVWTDGTDNWTAVDGWFDANWTMLGCGDFDGDGKDSVLMSLYGGLFYSVDLDGTLASLGDLNWSGWEFGAVGDFAGDGRDDVVLLHRESGTVVMLADGNADSFERLGQLDASDWSVAGAGDFDGDGKADLLVRQTSTGIAGAYASADMSKWSTVTTDYLLA